MKGGGRRTSFVAIYEATCSELDGSGRIATTALIRAVHPGRRPRLRHLVAQDGELVRSIGVRGVRGLDRTVDDLPEHVASLG